jgi:hypothetical protein
MFYAAYGGFKEMYLLKVKNASRWPVVTELVFKKYNIE